VVAGPAQLGCWAAAVSASTVFERAIRFQHNRWNSQPYVDMKNDPTRVACFLPLAEGVLDVVDVGLCLMNAWESMQNPDHVFPSVLFTLPSTFAVANCFL
jgi:hypothetical protein